MRERLVLFALPSNIYLIYDERQRNMYIYIEREREIERER